MLPVSLKGMSIGVLPTIRELGIGGAIPVEPGISTAAFKKPEDIKDNRARMPRYQGENFYKNLEL